MSSSISKRKGNKPPYEAQKGGLISDLESLEKIISDLKKSKKKIVLTQGVWDLLHIGHAIYLEKAKSYGDVLVVGVDSDELTQQRKGPNRPIVPQDERVNILAHLRHVDIVVVREVNYDIGYLIRVVCPDVLVTSKSTPDFKVKQKRDYKGYCKEIVTLAPQATTSTTARIRNLTMDGAEQLAKEVHKITEKFIKQIKKGK